MESSSPRRIHDTDPVDDRVLAAARRGDRGAMRRIHLHFAPLVLGYARGQGVDDPDVIANETLYRVLRDLSAFAGSPDRFRSWVFTIAHNLIVDAHRHRARRPVTVELDQTARRIERRHATPSPAGLVADRIEVMEVLGWIAELAPDQRAVLLLRFVADLSIAETAEVVGKRPGAVKALQHRGVAALRRRIDDRGVSPGPEATFTTVT